MAQWFEFRLLERPYYDGQGNVLTSIEGRRNRPGIDEFSGGGKIYPELPGTVVKRFEKDGKLFVLIDAPKAVLDNLTAKKQAMTYQASPKQKREYNFSDFKAKKIAAPEPKPSPGNRTTGGP